MAKFGINDIMDIKGKSSDTDGANEYKEIWLNPYEVKPSDSNFYAQENIEELADSFLAVVSPSKLKFLSPAQKCQIKISGFKYCL